MDVYNTTAPKAKKGGRRDSLGSWGRRTSQVLDPGTATEGMFLPQML
jgi:hypothetical protein